MHSCPAHDVIWRRDARVLVFHATRGLDGRGFTSVASAGFVICHPPLPSFQLASGMMLAGTHPESRVLIA